jgi:hypothetical protein
MSEDLKKGIFMGAALGAAILGGGILIGYHLRGAPAVSPVVVNAPPPPAAEPAPPPPVNVTVSPAPEKPCPPAQPTQVTAMAPAPPMTATAKTAPRNLDRGF